MKKKFCIVTPLLFALVCLCVDIWAQEVKIDKPLSFDSERWNVGRVDSRKGAVAHSFEFQNTTMYPVVIRAVVAGCGCTTTDYPRRPIEPGAKGKIDVVFDPVSIDKGPFSNNIYVAIADVPVSTVLTVAGEVVTSIPPVEQECPYDAGTGLRLGGLVADFYYVEHNRPDTIKMRYANTLSKNIELGFDVVPQSGHISVAAPKSVCAGCRGEILIIYSANSADKFYGRTVNKIYPTINGARAGKPILVKALVIDKFEKSDMDGGPRAKILPLFHYFGTMKRGEHQSHKFVLKNEGTVPLTIHKVELGRGSSIEFHKLKGRQVKAGRSVEFTCTLDTSRAPKSVVSGGEFIAVVTFITDDPVNPVREVWLVANLE